MWYRIALEQNEIQDLINFFSNKYPEIVLRINEYDNKIKLDKIYIPKELRGQGIGTEIITALKEYSQKVGKPIVLNPEPEKATKQQDVAKKISEKIAKRYTDILKKKKNA